MSDISTILTDTCTRLFADLVTADSLRQAEAGTWPDALWSALEENGLTRPLVPEDQGGVGVSWQDTAPILYAAGFHGAPVPLAETIVAGWLLAQAGQAVPQGAIACADGGGLSLSGAAGNWSISGRLDRVPWGAAAGHVLASVEHDGQTMFVLVDPGSTAIEADQNIGRDPRDGMVFDNVVPVSVADVPARLGADALLVYGALARSVQMAGAVAAVLDHCVSYAGDRVQFGRRLAKFQAIQQQLAGLATEAAAAQIAALSACRSADLRDMENGLDFEVATAKIRTGEAAGRAAAIGHQLHGAIGFTDEHRLHYLTRRLWSWRSEFGAESYWSERLGRAVMARGADQLWPTITSR
ncbi:MAG: acyl-CoA dehydrogenase [Alphaproteobacteria bacterium]|jgi:acyl-CoA dehydrogenase